MDLFVGCLLACLFALLVDSRAVPARACVSVLVHVCILCVCVLACPCFVPFTHHVCPCLRDMLHASFCLENTSPLGKRWSETLVEIQCEL